MIIELVKIIFWSSLSLILYTYLLYPLLLKFLILFRRNDLTNQKKDYFPSVTIIFSVYNEDKILMDKLNNLVSIDYPADKLEILIGSDGSTDNTVQILENSNIKYLRYLNLKQRRGKSAVLNDLVHIAKGEILVFTDANTMFQKDTVRNLVKHFSSESIGGVCGDLKLSFGEIQKNELGEPWYWLYENNIKYMESRINTIAGASGGIYAIRKNLYVDLPVNKAVVDDFLIPLHVVMKGFRVIYESSARAFEKSTGSVSGEFRRKVRIGASNFNTISEFKLLLNPKNGFISFVLWSHKIIRWFAPLLLILLFASIFLLNSYNIFFTIIFFGSLVFIIIGLIGLFFELFHIPLGIFGLPYYFLAMNAALFVGFLKYLFGKQKPTWEVIR